MSATPPTGGGTSTSTGGGNAFEMDPSSGDDFGADDDFGTGLPEFEIEEEVPRGQRRPPTKFFNIEDGKDYYDVDGVMIPAEEYERQQGLTPP